MDLALDTLKELSTTIRDSFGLYLNKTASDLIAGITGGIYSSISIDENLNAFLNTRRKLIPLEQVSSGTARPDLSGAAPRRRHFIQGDADRLPLIFDDSFVLYDDERLRTVLKWLPTAYSGQILVFTCHEREMRVLKEEGAAVHEVRL